MNSPISLQDVANIVTFIAPGYFALKVYSLIYAKRERDFSKLLIESVIYSLPLVTLTNIIWQKVFSLHPVAVLDISYAILLFTVACGVGGMMTLARSRWPVTIIAEHLGLGSPNEDFLKTQLLNLSLGTGPKPVTITMRTGEVFSGTIYQMSRYAHGGQQYFYFNNLAWFNGEKDRWDTREGGIIVECADIAYIQTPRPEAKRKTPTSLSAKKKTVVN